MKAVKLYRLRRWRKMGPRAYREQFFDMELEADAEHQEDDAHLRQLFGQRAVRDESRRVRSDQRAGEEIADDVERPMRRVM